MFRLGVWLIALIAMLSIVSCGGSTAMRDARSQLAPEGKLRVGVNFGNALLASKDASGKPSGIAVDLAQEVARRFDVALDIREYQSAGKMADGAAAGEWDIAFLATDPARAGDIAFTSPYMEIDATYLVPANSSLKSLADVDRTGVRIAVSEKSAYDLFLTREIKSATLVRVPGVDASVDLFFRDKLDALAGLRPLLTQLSAERPQTRVLDGRFSTVDQAIGTPKTRAAGAAYLQEFVNDIRTSGFLKQVIERNGVQGVTIASAKSE